VRPLPIDRHPAPEFTGPASTPEPVANIHNRAGRVNLYGNDPAEALGRVPAASAAQANAALRCRSPLLANRKFSFDGDAATRLLHQLVAQVDQAWPETSPTLVEADTTWRAYALAEDSRLRTALADASRLVGLHVDAKIAGPSNIGNYLAGLGIPATAGFGVAYVGLHGTDERIRLDTIPIAQAVYHAAALALLGVG
jgi:acetylornithine deacetylase/succinyl-diaminopimelate desuccinylase-like protein